MLVLSDPEEEEGTGGGGWRRWKETRRGGKGRKKKKKECAECFDKYCVLVYVEPDTIRGLERLPSCCITAEGDSKSEPYEAHKIRAERENIP